MAVTGLRVWRVQLDQPNDPRWRRQLGDAERAHASQLASRLARRRYVVAHAALRTVLGRLCGVRGAALRFGTESGGRPYLELPDGRPAPEFNLSHSGSWALVAVAPPGCRVGVDIQRNRRGLDYMPMACWMYDEAELAHLRAVDPLSRRAEFFRVWTAKEAYVKAIGVGVAGIRDARLRPVTGPGPARVHTGAAAGTGAGWPVHWLHVAPGYAAAVVHAAIEVGAGSLAVPCQHRLERRGHPPTWALAA